MTGNTINAQQIIINVSDTIPPENYATVDKGVNVGTVYTKEQSDGNLNNVSENLDNKIEIISEQVKTDFKGVLKPTDSAPTEDGSYKPSVSSEDDKPSDPNSTDWGKVYANAGNLRAKTGYDTMFYKKGTVWKKSETLLPNSAKKVFNKTDDNFPSTMKAAEMEFGWTKSSLDYFKPDSNPLEQDLSSSFTSGYLKRDNTIFADTTNKLLMNVPVSTFTKLIYNCYPSVITSGLASQYCAILGKKADGTFVVIRESALIPNNPPFPQTKVNEVFDVSGFVSISISIGNMTDSQNQTPIIKLIEESNPYTGVNGVRDFIIDQIESIVIPEPTAVIKEDAKLVLNDLKTFSASDVTLASAAISGGIINMTGTSSVVIEEGTLNENSEITFTYKETTASNSMFGFYSLNPHGYKHNVMLRYNTSGTNLGKLEIIAKNDLSYSQLSSTVNSNYSIGDYLKMGIKRVGLKYFFFVQNLTKGWSIKMEQTTTPLGVPFVAHNASKSTVRNSVGNIQVLNYKHTCFSKNIDRVILGDSITFGQSANIESGRWASKVSGNNLVMGGGADTTAMVLSHVQEVVKINPKQALLMIGGNDILFNVSSATWQQNLRDIRAALVNAGIEIIHCFPTPRTGASTLIDFLKTEPTFALDYKIDSNTALMNGNANTLSATYNSGDNLHPNSAGHVKIAEIVNSLL